MTQTSQAALTGGTTEKIDHCGLGVAIDLTVSDDYLNIRKVKAHRPPSADSTPSTLW